MTDPGPDAVRNGRTSPDDAAGPTVDELVDLLRRERADFRNYQRRVAQERAADAEVVRGRLLEPLFPLLDDLGRAFHEVPAALAEDPWARGIGMLRSRLEAALAGLGLESVGTVGEPFDPTRHEAVHHEPDPSATRQDVALVVRPGYRLGERLLRPAEVVVRGPVGSPADGSGPAPASPSNEIPPPEPVAHGHPDDDPEGG
jgi:molecular chaperone GrpE